MRFRNNGQRTTDNGHLRTHIRGEGRCGGRILPLGYFVESRPTGITAAKLLEVAQLPFVGVDMELARFAGEPMASAVSPFYYLRPATYFFSRLSTAYRLLPTDCLSGWGLPSKSCGSEATVLLFPNFSSAREDFFVLYDNLDSRAPGSGSVVSVANQD
jgi:hypothetical protein